MSNNFSLYIPISKIDKEARTVAGWATTEEIDKQGEVVDYLGSKEAFANWQGNIREMHEPRAVGKAIEILPSDDDKKVWVKAYISKGSEDTWEKVKEGVLTGFSIGGQTVHKTVQVIKDVNSGGQKTVSRIMKYRLNELSLVDNPANPGCSFELIKSVDGVPYQTAIVEDSKKFVITESEDPLKYEVDEHRAKADSLIKKVLDKDELDALGDDSFGVVRKYEKNGTSTKERLIPMPDKVHAVRALEIINKYALTEEEKQTIHKKAQGILGAAYENYKSLNRGGEDNMNKEVTDKLMNLLEGLSKRLENLEKSFEGIHKPVAGSKEQPKESTSTPELGESAPKEAGAADGVQTQNADGAAPVKATETGNVAKAEEPTSLPKQEEVVHQSAPEESGHPAEGDVRTQPEAGAVSNGPVKCDSPADMHSEAPAEAHSEVPSEESDEEKEKKRKQQEQFAAKSADNKSDNDLSKVVEVVESLRKRFDSVEQLLNQPKPRKYRKIEKISDGEQVPTVDSKLQNDIETIKKWNAEGKALTPSEQRFKEDVVSKMLDGKFGKAL